MTTSGPIYTEIVHVDSSGNRTVVTDSYGEFFNTSMRYKAGHFHFSVPNNRGQNSGTFAPADTIQYFYGTTNPPTQKVFDGFVDDINYSSQDQQGMTIIRGKARGTILANTSVQPEVYVNKRSSYIISDIGAKYFTQNNLLDDFETAAKVGSWATSGTTDALAPSIGSMNSLDTVNVA